MGRGDKKTKRGKITIGSFGVSRPARTKAAPAPAQAEAAETEAPSKAAKKPRAKKTEE